MNKILKIILQVLGGEQAANEFEKAGGGIQSLVKSVAGLAILQQAGQWLADFGKQAFDSAAKAERLGRATDNLSQAIGSSGEAMVSGIQAATGGTVDQLTAMESANKALMLGVVQSQDEMNKLAKMATVLGSAMGQDAATSIDNLVVGMGRMSPEILDNLGLTVKMDQATAAYAVTIGKTVDQLTEQERKQAFTNAVLAAGEARMATLGGQAEDTATKTERLGAAWADFSAEFGQLLSGPLTSGIDLATTFVSKLEEGAQAWQGIGAMGETIAEAERLKELEAQRLDLLEKIKQAKSQPDDSAALQVAPGTLVSPEDLAKTTDAAEELQRQLSAVEGEIVKMTDANGKAATESDILEKKALKAKMALNAEKIAADNLAGALRGAAAASARYGAQADMIAAQQERADAAQRGVERRRIEQSEEMGNYGITTYEQYKADKENTASAGAGIGQSMGQSIADSLRSAVESQIKPTLAEVWSPGGGEEARIDEWGRRAATIMTQGLNSEWIPALNAQFGGTDFWQPIQAAIAAGDTAGAQNLLGNLLTQNPQALWDKELIKQRVIQQLQQDNARTELINAVTAELSGQGIAVDAGQVQAAMGVSPVAQPVADSLANGLPGALAEKEIGAGMIAELGAQVGKADEELRGLTNAIAAGIESNLKAAMATTGASLLNVITSSVAATLGIELRP